MIDHPGVGLPTLRSSRLVLRPFCDKDSERIRELAGDERVAKYTRLPHPYPAGLAEEWISKHGALFADLKGLPLAVTLADGGLLIGTVSFVSIDKDASRAAIGYWIGVDYWGQGYCTEACLQLVGFGFEQMKLNKLSSSHAVPNVGSGRVMQKIGMRQEGLLRAHAYRGGELVDVACYGLLASEFLGRGSKT